MTAQTVYLAIGSAFSAGVLTELSGNGYARASASATFDNVGTVMTIQGAEFGPATGTWTAGTTLALFDASSGGNLLFAIPLATPALTSGQSYSVPSFVMDFNTFPLTVGSGFATQATVGFILGGAFANAVIYTGVVKVVLSSTGTLIASTGILTLTDGATIAYNVALASYATVTLGATGRTLTMSGGVQGQVVVLEVVQDATGSRTVTTWTNVTWAAGTAPTLTTTASATDVLRFTYNATAGKFRGETVGKAFA
jgi:hypothetical protein